MIELMETTSAASLVPEEFECGVCSKQLDRPKLLPCLHSICQECLQAEKANPVGATCPVCSAPVDEDVTNAQDNTFAANLLSKLQLQKRIEVGLDIWCSLCQACGDDKPAISLCFECDHFMCLRCCHSHQLLTERYRHLVKTLDELRTLGCEEFVTFARKGKQTICPDHKEQNVRFFCKTCSMSICCTCLLLSHISPDHCYHDIKQEVILKKEELKQMVETIQENHNKFIEAHNQLKCLKESLDIAKNNTEALIKRKASATIEEIDRQGDALLTELESGCSSVERRLTNSLNNAEQIIKRLGAGKVQAENLLRFGSSEEMMVMYNTINSALTAVVTETFEDLSKEDTWIEFIECTLETQNLLGTLFCKEEPIEEADDSEAEDMLLERPSAGESPGNFLIHPAAEEMLRATVSNTDEFEFENVMSPNSCSQSANQGQSDSVDSLRLPFTNMVGQVEWVGEEDERSEQTLTLASGCSASANNVCPSGHSFPSKFTEKHQKASDKRRNKQSQSPEDGKVTRAKKQRLHSEHNYSVKLASDSQPELLVQSNMDGTMPNISFEIEKEPWQLPTEKRIKISSENSEDNRGPSEDIFSHLSEMQKEASTASMSSAHCLGPNLLNPSIGDRCQDKAAQIRLSLEMGGSPLVFFQLQTTGMGSGDIIQLSAVSGEKIFDKYILPREPVSAGATNISGIQVTDGILYLRGEPQTTCSIQDAMTGFLQFLQSLGRSLLAGHNIWIRDCQVIYKAWEDLFMKDQFARCVTGFLDTLWLARYLVPRLKVKNYKLKNLVTACVRKSFISEGPLSNVRATQELYSVLNPTPGQIHKSQFSLSQLECRISLQPLFDQQVISRLVADNFASEGISLHILQLAHNDNPQFGLRDLLSGYDNLGLLNLQLVVKQIRSYLEQQKGKRRYCQSTMRSLKVEKEWIRQLWQM
ncbi:protein PML-like isoform X2 [Rhincodon typus]|uniref:protein PML-like isoform X2 n=1 Tax=Rhincodon typus TaxID=259920 RepID=UPI00203032C9|nr:protein PML-like isoform X2 [Rhincodon typus]